ncbi:MAG TPA: hypothetical protein VK154_04505 [Chitinophagales bacterium]|nr:hypothetical protein [Chitinophagales bacterium]
MKVPEQNNPATPNDKRTGTNQDDVNDPSVQKQQPNRDQQQEEEGKQADKGDDKNTTKE